jgi:hypothetical protein
MNRAVVVALLLPLMFNIQAAFAGTTNGQVVQHFTYQPPGSSPLFFVHISTAASNPAGCGTTTMNSNRWVTRIDTAAGKAHMAMILAAKLAGKPVTIWGKGGTGYTNPCEDWGDTEGIFAVVGD